MYFSATLKRGQAFEFVNPIPGVVLDTPTVPVVVRGSFVGFNALRDPLKWGALPGKTEGGISFPGRHRLEALEDNSIYACVSHLPPNLTEVTPDMFKLDHSHVESGDRSYVAADGYKAVIVMSGAVRFGGEAVTPGTKIDVPAAGAVELMVDSPAHLVGYRLVSV